MSVPAPTPQDKGRKNLVSVAITAAFLTLPIAIYDIYLGLVNGFTNRTPFFLLAAGVLILLFITSIVIIRTRYAEKPVVGTWHILILLSISFLLSSALQSNVGAEMGAALLIIALVVSIQTLPPEQVFRGAILGIVASLLAGLLVFYSPLPQEADPRIDNVTVWVARVGTIAVLGIAMSQFRSLNLLSKLLISFLGVVVLISMTFNIILATSTTNELTEQVGLQLNDIAKARGNLLGEHINSQIEVLQALALDENIRQSVRAANALKPDLNSILTIDEQWRQMVASDPDNTILLRYTTNSLSNDLRAFQDLNPEHIEVFVTDQNGALVSATNLTSDYYQADEEWWQLTYQRGRGGNYISLPEFDESAGQFSILLAVPIYDTRYGDLIGILRSTTSLEAVMIILREPIGLTGKAGILFPGNSFIDTHQEVLGNLTSENLQIAQISAKQTFIRAVYEGDDSILAQAPVKTQDETAIINKVGWKILVSQHTEEALESVHQQVRSTGFIATIMASIAALFSLLVAQGLSRPILNLTNTASKLGKGDLSARTNVTAQDEIGQLANTFNNMAEQLQESLSGLEQRVSERTAELEESSEHLQKRASQFQAIAQLARTISTIQDLDTLLSRVTQQVSKQFDFYHAGLFLLDESNKYAVLSAANSEGGQRMLARKHKLGVGQTGIVGYVTATGNPRIALDTGADAVYFDNPDMPDTRSEMALPLRVGSKIIGALDVQSTESNAFSEDDIEVLSILADIVSVAIENARLFEESQRVLADAQSAFGEYTKVAWKQATGKRKSIGYTYSGATIRPLDETSINQSRMTTTYKNNNKLAVPIKLRDQVIGTMNIGLPEDREWDPDEIDITQALAQRVGIAIESATLLEESRRRAARESTISDISAKISATAEIERIMQVAVGELRQALGASEVTLQINPDNQD